MSADVVHVLNVFEADLNVSGGVDGVGFFVVEGVPSDSSRFEALGYVARKLERKFDVPLAVYSPSPSENYVIGFVENVRDKEFEVGVFKVKFVGTGRLEFNAAARRALTELLNRTKAWELREGFWGSYRRHVLYPVRPKDLQVKFPGCGLKMFRGVFFRYAVLGDGRVVLTLDTATHYVRAESLLGEMRRRGVKWLRKLIERRRDECRRLRRKFRGLWVYYLLDRREIPITGVDPRPISEILLDREVVIDGVKCKTVAEYLKAKYKLKNLDEKQPGIICEECRNWRFPPQFLFRVVPNKEVPSEILNAETYLLDVKHSKKDRDPNFPARARWDLINRHFSNYFGGVVFGGRLVSFRGLICLGTARRFEKPVLIAGEGKEVSIEELARGASFKFYRRPKTREVLVFYEVNGDECECKAKVLEFYSHLKKHAEDSCGVRLPEKPVLLEPDCALLRSQLVSLLKSLCAEEIFCVGCIKPGSEVHDEFTNICGEQSVPSKCVTWPTIERVLRGSEGVLRNLCFSILTRGGGIPWILKDPLSFDCYVAVDVGRSKAEYWAMSIVYDRFGRFTVSPGKIKLGEKLEESSVRLCVEKAREHVADGKSIVFMRHGDVYREEVEAFKKALEEHGFDFGVILSVKSRTPHRIFRKQGRYIIKPLSGDYCILDENTIIVCGAGADEYEHGMPKPVFIETAWSKEKVSIEKVARDLFQLTYLNWGSPGRSYSLPAPLHLAHRFSKELGRGVCRAGAPY